MAKFQVLVTDGMAEGGQEILKQRPDLVELDLQKGLSAEELTTKIEKADAVVVRSATKITEEVLQAAKRLKLVARAGIGIDNVDVKAATQRGIAVMNTPHANAVTTAEHSIALLFAAARKVPQANRSLWQGKWDRKSFVGTELTGKTVGVVGVGNIGAMVAERLKGLQMNVLACDSKGSRRNNPTLKYEFVALEDIYSRCDIITLHIPYNEQTHHLINADALSKMKKNTILINCARGGVVNDQDLFQALEEEQIGSAGLDVFEKEPPPEDYPLLHHPRVVSTPHIGAQTHEAQLNVSIEIARQVLRYFETGEVANAITS